MHMKAAVAGAGRMGSLVAEMLPAGTEKVVIDRELAAAERVAGKIGGSAADGYRGAAEADVLFLLLPAPAIPDAAEEAAAFMKPGAVIVNMSTKGVFREETAGRFPEIRFVNAKIIGHASSIRGGAPGLVVTDAPEELFRMLSGQLTKFQVVKGDPSLVPVLSTIASSEGIRAAVSVKKQAALKGAPEEWMRPLIYTVLAGTARAYVDDDMGEFAKALAEKLEKEG